MTGKDNGKEQRIVIKAGKSITLNEITASKVALSPTNYYGSTVNYTGYSSGYNGGWKIFYSDENNIFLIASDYVQSRYIPTVIGGLNAYDGNEYIVYWDYTDGENSATKQYPILSTNSWNRWTNYDDNYNAKCVSSLLKTDDWSSFTNTTYADYAIGGPTLKMFCESWNANGYEEFTCENKNEYGYYLGENETDIDVSSDIGKSNSLYFPNRSADYVYGYWLATPCTEYVDSGRINLGCIL